MAWLWESWEEYVEWCHPSGIQRGRFRLSRSQTELGCAKEILDSLEELTAASNELQSMGFSRESRLRNVDEAFVRQAWNHVIKVVYAGETLLLYHKRLAMDESSDGFLHQNSILEHWERYAVGERVVYEVQQLVEDVEELIDGYRRLEREDERLLLHNLDLPKDLERDFVLARNLFSIGIDDVALFITARGLEKVLRQIARDRKITIEARGKQEPAGDADLNDLIETMSRIRWKAKRTPLISKETRTLLQYIRTVRNSGAHRGDQEVETENLRQTASIIARTTSRLWKNVANNRARFDQTNIQRSWP